MSWALIDDQSTFHAKVIAAGNSGWGACVRMIAWSMAHLTDGKVPVHVASLIATTEELASLERARLVKVTETEVVIHDFLDWNKSAKQIKKDRAAKAKAGKYGGIASGKRRSKTEARASASAQAPAPRLVHPPTNPSPSLSKPLQASPLLPRGENARVDAPPPENVTEVKLTAEDRYAQAWARGVSSATANPCSVPAAKARGSINTSTQTHFTGLRGDALLQAIEASAAQYVKAKPKDAAYGGFTPAKWLTWLDSGKPNEVTAVRGRTSVQPTDMNAPWMQDGYGETLGKTGGDQ